MSVSGKSLDLLCWRRSGGSTVIQSPRSALANLSAAGFAARGALVAALLAALALAGCGRKSGLDAPPMAAAGDLQAGGQPGPAPALGPDGKPVSPSADKRKTLLDWLID
jgi:predicted small lipoprotein YifL